MGQSVDTTNRDFTITFEADRAITWCSMERVEQDVLRSGPGSEAAAAEDLWLARIRNREHRLLGLYEFRGETLLILMANASQARPTTLTTSGLSTAVLYTLGRVGSP